MKLAIHVTNLDRWRFAIANAHNMLALHPDAKVSIFANAEAVNFYLSENVEDLDDLAGLNKAGIQLNACNNTIKAMEIDKSDLPEYVKIVPAVIEALTMAQMEGYAYVKS